MRVAPCLAPLTARSTRPSDETNQTSKARNGAGYGGVLPVMAANPDQLPADGAERLVIRIQKSKVIAFSAGIGTISLVGAGLMVVRGTLSAALFCLGIGGLVVYAMVGAYLWVDGERVGVRRFPWGASCRRDQLGRLQIVFARNGNSACEFVRKD